MNTLGQNIRKARLAAHMTQEMLAEAVLISAGAISHYETGRYIPQHDTLEMIAMALKVSVEELYQSEDPVAKKRTRSFLFDDLTEEEAKLLRRILVVVRNYVRNVK